MSESGVALKKNSSQQKSEPISSRNKERPPTCNVCGRQDDTLRFVVYPFAFSLVFVTFRRAFTGCWCRVDRTFQLVVASLITATFGWLGIPYGLVWTPVTLFKLARGGEQLDEVNTALLRRLAEHKLEQGNAQGAIDCLEESLRFGDDETTQERLHKLRVKFGLPVQQIGWQHILFTFASALLGAFLIGAVVGILDYAIESVLSFLLGGKRVSIYVAIATWTPFIALLFVGGLALARVAEWALARIKCRGDLLAVVTGVVMAALTAYSVLYATAISPYIAALISGNGVPVLMLLTWGLVGATILIQSTALPHIVYALSFAAGGVYYLGIAIVTGIRTARWQQRLSVGAVAEDTTQPTQTAQRPISGREWLLGCGAVLLVLCLFGALLIGGVNHWLTLSSRTSLDVTLSCPDRVHRGETFEAVLTLHNPEDRSMTDPVLDIDGTAELNFFDGIDVSRTRPPYEHRDESEDRQLYSFRSTIAPGRTQTITLELTAEEQGQFRGLLFVDVTTEGRRRHTRGTPLEVTVLS